MQDKIETAISMVTQNEADLRPSVKPTPKMKGFFKHFVELDEQEAELNKKLSAITAMLASLGAEREDVALALAPMLEDVEDRMIMWKEYKAKIEEIAAAKSSRVSYGPAWKELMLSLSEKLKQTAADLLEKHRKTKPGSRELHVTMDPSEKPRKFRLPDAPESVGIDEGNFAKSSEMYGRESDEWWAEMDALAADIDAAHEEVYA